MRRGGRPDKLARGEHGGRVALGAAEELRLMLGRDVTRHPDARDWAEHAGMIMRRMGLDPEHDYPPLLFARGDPR